jgi:hypothetical protein
MGGGALLLWLLWRGRGKSTNHGDEAHGRARSVIAVTLLAGDRIELDGVPADLPTTVARARTADMAKVHANGDARAGWVIEVLKALRAAGVDIGKDDSILSWQ